MFRRAFITSSAALAASGLLFSESRGQADAVRKVAFLVGVSKYHKDGLRRSVVLRAGYGGIGC